MAAVAAMAAAATPRPCNRSTLNRKVRIVSHTMQAWKSRRVELANTYRGQGGDVLLLQSHGVAASHVLKVAG